MPWPCICILLAKNARHLVHASVLSFPGRTKLKLDGFPLAGLRREQCRRTGGSLWPHPAPAVVAELHCVERHGAVRRQRVGVKEEGGGRLQALLRVQRAVLLQPGVVVVVVAAWGGGCMTTGGTAAGRKVVGPTSC